MRQTATPARIAAAVVLIGMVAIEAFALRAGTLGVVVIGVVALLALVLIVTSANLIKIGMGATVLSAATLTWNGWYLGPLRVGDVLPLVALAAFAIAVPAYAFRSPPWWVKQLVGGLVLLLVLSVLFPASRHYLNQRLTVDAGGRGVFVDYSGMVTQNIGIIAKFIIAIAFIPVAFAAAARIDRRAVRWLALAFCLGTGLSGFVAFVDHTGVVSLGHYITRISGSSARTTGFTTHPNFLAETLVLAAPFACWMLTSRIKWERIAGGIALASMVLGVYGSGSRGGTACIVISIFLAFLLLPRTRPHLPTITLGILGGVGIIAVIFPSFGLQILRVTRIYGNSNTEGSDTVRDWVAAQGRQDFFESPFIGIGMQSSTDASQVWLQQLAAGGLLLFGIMLVYLLGAAWASFRMIPRTPIAAAVCAAVLSKIPMNFVETSVTDRLYYVQEAILVALLAVAMKVRDPNTDDEFDPSYVPPPGSLPGESADEPNDSAGPLDRPKAVTLR